MDLHAHVDGLPLADNTRQGAIALSPVAGAQYMTPDIHTQLYNTSVEKQQQALAELERMSQLVLPPEIQRLHRR